MEPAPAPVIVRPHTDWIGKIVGMLVFLLGVALLGIVFYNAFSLFNQTPSAVLGLHFSASAEDEYSLSHSLRGVLMVELSGIEPPTS